MWKKRRKLDPDTMVYIVKGKKYDGIKEALDERGNYKK
jgi:hypothetical protein